jgi:hypothetical protein
MSWPSVTLWCAGASLVVSAGVCYLLQKNWIRRFRILSKEVGRFSEDLIQVLELQAEVYRRVCRNIHEVEEKVFDLSIPSTDAPHPLERRHQVLALTRKGMTPEEVSRRLDMPKGEVELILSLRKFADGAGNQSIAPISWKGIAGVSS